MAVPQCVLHTVIPSVSVKVGLQRNIDKGKQHLPKELSHLHS